MLLNKLKGLGKKCIEQRKAKRLPWNKTIHRNSSSTSFAGPDPSCAQESVLESLGLGKCQVLGTFCCFQGSDGFARALSSHGAFPLQTGVSCSGSAPCRQSANSWRRFAACVASPQQIPPPSSVPASLPWSHRDRSWWCQVCFSQLWQCQQNCSSSHFTLGTMILGSLWRTWLAQLCVADNRLSQQNSPKYQRDVGRAVSRGKVTVGHCQSADLFPL